MEKDYIKEFRERFVNKEVRVGEDSIEDFIKNIIKEKDLEIDKAEERAYKEWERVNGCKQCFHICHDKIKLDKMLAKAEERGRLISWEMWENQIKKDTIKEIKEMIMGEDIALKPETKNGYNTAIKDIINYLNR